MRIVIDMQGAQSSGNWNRGIGRYTMSLALAVVRNRGDHEVLLALNGAFPPSVERIRAAFQGHLSPDSIRVWFAPAPMAFAHPKSQWKRQSGELVREAFLASLKPDFVIVSSLFEGLHDDAATSLRRPGEGLPTAVILYDLIPFLHRKPYLEDPVTEVWYLDKIEQLKRAHLALAISESSRQEAIQHLGFSPASCVNISADADDHFQEQEVTASTKRHLCEKYGLTHNFVMYTGGIDHRKNIEGLIRAFAKLPLELRATHQLAIVCSVQEENRVRLLSVATQEGVAAEQVVFTGFVPEEDLIALYNLCQVFVFPSWHEGFGLPALEAMRCGAPVVAAHTSSLPEVVGWEDALFDPHSTSAMALAIERALTDPQFREQLVANGKNQSRKFSWDTTALRAIDALERVSKKQRITQTQASQKKQRLAYVSPLPPERSGISDYSTSLLPALAQHYEIDVVSAQGTTSNAWVAANCPMRSVQWFRDNHTAFDRVIYHFGNSAIHQHMFDLLDTFPGVVVLHDFYLSGVLHHMDALGHTANCYADQLYKSHGYVALYDRSYGKHPEDVIWKYPCSLGVIEKSVGMIAHSRHSIQLAQQWYGDTAEKWSLIPLLRAPAGEANRVAARTTLGFSPSDFVVCSFGTMGPSKLNDRLLQAWLKSDLARAKNCHLTFVGENHAGDFGQELLARIQQHASGTSVRITGWTDVERFHTYLAAADLGVQLRTRSRGETSAAVLDCMNHGLATIVNANGSMADLPEDAVWKLPDEFDDDALVHALETLWRDSDKRYSMGTKAKKIVLEKHNPERCAAEYHEAIEDFYLNHRQVLPQLLDELAAVALAPISENDLQSLAKSIAISIPPLRQKKQLLIDISGLIQNASDTKSIESSSEILKYWLLNPPSGWRIEPVYTSQNGPYRYARQYTADFLGIPSNALNDEPLELAHQDRFFVLLSTRQLTLAKKTYYRKLSLIGISVRFLMDDLSADASRNQKDTIADQELEHWLEMVMENDGVICRTEAAAEVLRRNFKQNTAIQEHAEIRNQTHKAGPVTELALSLEKIESVTPPEQSTDPTPTSESRKNISRQLLSMAIRNR